MSTPEVRRVAGTVFTFPELPPRADVDPGLFDKLVSTRTKILDNARKGKCPEQKRPGLNGTVLAALTALAGPRTRIALTPAERGVYGYLSVSGASRPASYWSPGPRAGTLFLVDTEAWRYVLVRARDLTEVVDP